MRLAHMRAVGADNSPLQSSATHAKTPFGGYWTASIRAILQLPGVTGKKEKCKMRLFRVLILAALCAIAVPADEPLPDCFPNDCSPEK